jgi:hypothetical protein
MQGYVHRDFSPTQAVLDQRNWILIHTVQNTSKFANKFVPILQNNYNSRK